MILGRMFDVGAGASSQIFIGPLFADDLLELISIGGTNAGFATALVTFGVCSRRDQSGFDVVFSEPLVAPTGEFQVWHRVASGRFVSLLIDNTGGGGNATGWVWVGRRPGAPRKAARASELGEDRIDLDGRL